MRELATIAKGAGIAFAGYAVGKMLAYFYYVTIARMLGPSDFGIFSIGIAILGVAITLATLGLYQGILHFVVIFESKSLWEKVKGTIFGGIKLQIASSFVSGAVLFLLAPFLAESYGIPELEGILRLFAFVVPLAVLTSNLLILTHAFKKIKYKVYVRNVFEILSKLVLAAGFLAAGFGLFGVATAFVLSSGLVFLLSLYLIQKHVFKIFGNRAKAVYSYGPLFSFSWPLFVVGFFSVVMASIDTVMLGYLSTTYNTGVYNIAVPTANFLIMPANALSVLFLPVITGLYAQKRIAEMDKTLKTVTRWLFSMVFPMALFSFVFAHDILAVLFGAVYAEGAAAFIVLVSGILLVSLVNPVLSILESIAKTKFILLNTVACGLVNIVLNMLLIPIFAGLGNAMIGAALATTAAGILWNALALAEVYIFTGLQPYNRAYSRPMIAALATIGLFLFGTAFVPSASSLAFPLNILLLCLLGVSFLAVYAVLFLALRCFQPEDIEMLRLAERKLGIRIGFVRNAVKRFI